MIGGQATAAAQVRVRDTLPPDLAAFTGRAAEPATLCGALRRAVRDGGGWSRPAPFPAVLFMYGLLSVKVRPVR